ncbi:hypothetical protein AVEN_109104-1 [Araneus ventricosus]|uniref:Uncharacterized protein n=1 Tax=Araneus ventricosus TaxID=182803 RepID=A0A4Y2SQ58_ARAVE|nr:hypothetical protein AVEN_109104-1 [Araneus ventricosus]
MAASSLLDKSFPLVTGSIEEMHFSEGLDRAKALLTFTRTGAIENGKLCSAITPKIRVSAFEILSHRGTFLSTGVRYVVAAAEDEDRIEKKLLGRE